MREIVLRPGTFMLFTRENVKKGRRCLINKRKKKKLLDSDTFQSNFRFSFLPPPGLMICRNARHLSETMVFNKHRIKSLSDPTDYIQYFNALERSDRKGNVVEIRFS